MDPFRKTKGGVVNLVNGLILALFFAVAIIIIIAMIGWKWYKEEGERSKELDKREKELIKQDRTIALLRKFCFDSTPVSVSTADLPEGVTSKEAFALMAPQYFKNEAEIEFVTQYGDSEEPQKFQGFISSQTVDHRNVIIDEGFRLQVKARQAAIVGGFLTAILEKADVPCG